MKYFPLIFFLFSFLFFISAHGASAAVLSISAPANSYNVGDIFKVEVELDTQGQTVNTVQATINFNPTQLEVSNINSGGSVLTLWPESPEYSNQSGQISFAGGKPGGFNGEGNVISIFFEAKQTGSGQVSFENNAYVLLNNGSATNAQISYQPLNLNIAPATGTPENDLKGSLQSDKTPPAPFKILLSSDPAVFNGQYFIVFSTQDSQSGINHYEVKEGNSNWATAASPYLLKNQNLKEIVYVKAVDNSGNARTEKLNLQKSFPYWMIILLVFVTIAAILTMLKLKLKSQSEKA